jgi:hypothetical protein
MKTPEQAYGEGADASKAGAPLEPIPFKGDRTRDASDDDKQTAHLRDCYVAGYRGDALPDVPKGIPAFV